MITADGKCTDCEPTIDWLKSRIADLEAENTRLRALVMRGAALDRTYTGYTVDTFSKECRKETKRWEK